MYCADIHICTISNVIGINREKRNIILPVGSYQLKSMFCSIERDLDRQKYKEPKKKNLIKEEFKAIRSLNKNNSIIIKPANKGSVIVILNKQSYKDEGQRPLHDTQFYEETDSDLTGEVIHRINLHAHNILQRGQITQHTCNYQLTLIGLDNFIYYPKFIKIHWIHQEDL